ncbi:PPR4 [Symbiodinium necroappetens]|uniref:PPR4 protein n=1 Tax=Symbiodinium necroappetens TaxID=1628268 RepID=A0A813C2R4_9DINO|nr:PPR4 [Symbiodinium necroappetens]
MRERAGAKFRSQARDAIAPLPLSQADKRLLDRLKRFSRKGDWDGVESAFSSYKGNSSQIYSQVMHAAFRCGRYQRGVAVYNNLCAMGLPKNLPVFTLATKLFAKAGDTVLVRKTWAEALETNAMDVPLAGARIDAAAEEGDIVSAATVLDNMTKQKLQPNLAHFTSAVRACVSAEGVSHNAANFLLRKVEEQGLAPELIFFTALIKSYTHADLGNFTAAYQKMKDFGIEPDRVFAETYLGTLLQPNTKGVSMLEALQGTDPSVLAAAREALQDFEAANVELSGLCRSVQRALGRILDM